MKRSAARAVFSSGWWQCTLHRATYATQYHEGASATGLTARLWAVLLWPASLFMKLLTHNEIMTQTVLEPRVFLSDRGGIILGARRIGADTVIHHDVTIGMNLMSGGLPDVGRRVWIGHDVVIHGEIEIGDGATILPRSVVTRSVPSGAIVGGNPARIVDRSFDNYALRNSLDPDPAVPQRSQTAAVRELINA